MGEYDYEFKKEIREHKLGDKYKDVRFFKCVESLTTYYTDKQYKFHKEMLQRNFNKLMEQNNKYDETLKQIEKNNEDMLKKLLKRGSKEYKEYQEIYKKWKKETKSNESYVDYCKKLVEQSKETSKNYLDHTFEENKKKMKRLNEEISLIEEVLSKGVAVLKTKQKDYDLDSAVKITDEQIQRLLDMSDEDVKKMVKNTQ